MSEKTTLQEYLQIIRDLEDGLIDITPQELGIVFEGLKDKVDGYVELMDYMEERADAIKAKATKLQAQAKSLMNARERVKDYVGYLMDTNDSPEINGKFYNIKVRKFYSAVPKFEASLEMFERYPEYISSKLSYSWDKGAIKEALGRGKLDFAELRERVTMQARVKK